MRCTKPLPSSRCVFARAYTAFAPFHALQVKRAPKALAALSAYAIQRSRALNFKLSVTKSEVDVLLCEFHASS